MQWNMFSLKKEVLTSTWMDLEGVTLSGASRTPPQRPGTVCVPLNEEQSNSRRRKVRWGWGAGMGESAFHGDTVSFGEDHKVLEEVVRLHSNGHVPNATELHT